MVGHEGAVLGVAWSPRKESVLVSAGADGGARVWDVRMGRGCLGVLDLEDEVGILHGRGSRGSDNAHVGPCNGVAWTPDGEEIVTVGHDERIRVWEAGTGRNTLVHFGAGVRNRRMAGVQPVVVAEGGRKVVLWPNERDVLVGDLVDHE